MTRTNDDKLRVNETRKAEVSSSTKHRMSFDEYRSRPSVMKELRHSTTGVTDKNEQLPNMEDKSSTLNSTSIYLPKKKPVSRQILNADRLK